MTKQNPPLPSVINNLISYDSESGNLVWRVRDVSFFTDGKKSAIHCMRVWNSKFANKPALNHLNDQGYLTGRIFYKLYRAHRVAWALHTGSWPLHEIDHVNGKRSDNRFTNLRDVTHQENGKNCARRVDNRSGVTGVHWDKRRSLWMVSIQAEGGNKFLGYFADIEDAINARVNGNAQYAFHSNHGRHQ